MKKYYVQSGPFSPVRVVYSAQRAKALRKEMKENSLRALIKYDGMAAFRNDLDKCDNPYRKRSKDWKAWNEGWEDAWVDTNR